MKEYLGVLESKGKKFAIVAARFNEIITKSLVEGAVMAFKQQNVPEKDLTLVWVPGAFEIPLIAKTLASANKYDAIVCLGAVIRGSTPHFDYVAGEMAGGIAKISLETGIPLIFGVLTTETIEQALERAGTKAGNKGYDAAFAALEMANLLNQISE